MMSFRTLWCPLCGSDWKIVQTAGEVQTRVPMTCVPCEEALPQMIHEADFIDETEMEGGRDAGSGD